MDYLCVEVRHQHGCGDTLACSVGMHKELILVCVRAPIGSAVTTALLLRSYLPVEQSLTKRDYAQFRSMLKVSGPTPCIIDDLIRRSALPHIAVVESRMIYLQRIFRS